MRKFYILISIFSILLLSLFIVSFIYTPNAVNVDAITPIFTDYNLTASASGIIKSSDKIEIKLDFDIAIKEIKKNVGEKVNIGDTLFIIDKEKTIELLKETYSEEELLMYKNYIDSYKLEYTSDYEGVISKINNNEIIPSGESVIEIYSGSGFIVSINVSEKDIANIEVGQEAEIMGEALKNKIYKGKVLSIANEASKNNSGNKNETTVNVILSIEDKENKLKSGYNVKAKIIYASMKNVASIPYDALKEDDKSYYVYKLYNSEYVYKSRVEVIAEENEYVIINGNIDQNSKICLVNENINEKIARVNVVSEGIEY